MLKKDELRDPNSCLNKAGADEPKFVLRANDPVAAQAIRHWASMACDIHEDDKVSSALEAANAMDQWRNARPPTATEVLASPSLRPTTLVRY